MAELDTIEITNPEKEDFEVRFNGELYTLKAGETKAYPKFLSFHIARHLSERMFGKLKEKLRKKHGKDNPFVPQMSTLFNHDNPERRKNLYNILKSKEFVEEAVVAYNLKGFVGEMKEYDDYVDGIKHTSAEPTSPKRGPGRPTKTPQE
jgi:hypothetical protein